MLTLWQKRLQMTYELHLYLTSAVKCTHCSYNKKSLDGSHPLWLTERTAFFFFFFWNQHLYMHDSHSTPVSVEFQHKHTSFYLMKCWLGDHLNHILFNGEKFKWSSLSSCNRTSWMAKTVLVWPSTRSNATQHPYKKNCIIFSDESSFQLGQHLVVTFKLTDGNKVLLHLYCY